MACRNNATQAVLGVLLRLTDSGSPLGWDSVGCAVNLAVRHVNERTGIIVPSLVNLSSSFSICALYFDTQSTARGAMEAYLEAKALGAQIVLGPARSATTEPVAVVAGVQVRLRVQFLPLTLSCSFWLLPLPRR